MHAIGGYFELEVSQENRSFLPHALGYQSARAAFLALLQSVPAPRIWLPHFICDGMLAATRKLPIETCFYSLDTRLGIASDLYPAADDLILYVNYFGICSQQVADALHRFDPKRIILDNSQAFFSPPSSCLASIYSPRKFFGVPDGGLLCTSHPIKAPDEVDQTSILRMEHLLMRLGDCPEKGYKSYQNAEASLYDMYPKGMSQLTQRLLKSIDYPAAKLARERNFNTLHSQLGSLNSISIPTDELAPLCYPFLTSKTGIREKLRSRRIYTPSYWTDVLSRVEPNTTEAMLVQKLIPLPCDQRYTNSDMERIIGIINE
jgi:hypothetical protein